MSNNRKIAGTFSFRRTTRSNLLVISGFIIVLLLALPPLHVYAASPPINVSNNAGDSTNPRVAANQNNVYVVWQDMTLGHLQIFISVSHDTGTTFSVPLNLSNDTGSAQDPHIATRGSHVYVVWQDSTPGHVQVFYSTSRDAGGTWSTPINLSNDSGAALHSRITATKTNVFVGWTDNTLGHDQFMLAVSQDNGATFGAAINVSNDGVAAASHREGGLGLLGMRERVEQAGGTLTVEPGPAGRGWSVSARLPRSGEAGLAA